MKKNNDYTWQIVGFLVLFCSMQLWYALLFYASHIPKTVETSTGEMLPQVPFSSPVEVQPDIPNVEPKVIEKVIYKTVIKKVYVKTHKPQPKPVMVPILPTPIVKSQDNYDIFCRNVGNIKIPGTRKKECQLVQIVDGHVKWR